MSTSALRCSDGSCFKDGKLLVAWSFRKFSFFSTAVRSYAEAKQAWCSLRQSVCVHRNKILVLTDFGVLGKHHEETLRGFHKAWSGGGEPAFPVQRACGKRGVQAYGNRAHNVGGSAEKCIYALGAPRPDAQPQQNSRRKSKEACQQRSRFCKVLPHCAVRS